MQLPTCFDLPRLSDAYSRGLSVRALIESVEAHIAAVGDDHVWIARVSAPALAARAAALDALPTSERGALFGVPFAIKDNIDYGGIPTTAGCPAFAYTPVESAPVVRRLEAAGAILVGKTNLDQFATGLVGVRSPYGVPRNPFHADYIPGGSSSGSAVAVAAGLVAFALGTDTAGSGRVPAAFNNIVGLKPTRGLVSARGVVPACRSLDCISIFALTVADAESVLDVAAGFDAADPYSRNIEKRAPRRDALRLGIPVAPHLTFFGDAQAERLFDDAISKADMIGATVVPIDFAPFAEAAALLYDGPWVAERTAALGDFIARKPEAVWPETRAIIAGGAKRSAAEVFRALDRLAALKRATEAVWQDIDALLLPTAPTIYRIAEVSAEPIVLNTRLGTFTNFVNLLDLAALALPTGFRDDGLPFGVTLVGPAWSDARLAAWGRIWQAGLDLPLGASGARALSTQARDVPVDGIELAVFGAHLSGQPLNHELRIAGAELVEATTTAPIYRLHALATTPPKPGLVRVSAAGAAIACEVWRIAAEPFGRFVGAIPAPLTIGCVELVDGRIVKGFLVEPVALTGTEDITRYGGWAAWRQQSFKS